MVEYNHWQFVLEGLVRSAKKTKFIDTVNGGNVISKCLEEHGIRDTVTKYMTDFIKRKDNEKNRKCNIKSRETREEGNKQFMLKAYEKSLQLYTKSVFLAAEGGIELSLALSSRSAALYHLGYFQECLQDIDLAFNKGYPSSKSEKLLLRKGLCLKRISLVQKAQEAFKEGAVHSEQRTRLQNQLVRELRSLNVGSNAIPCRRTDYTPDKNDAVVEGGLNPHFPNASSVVEVKDCPGKGRHVIATKDIKLGDVLFVEAPFSFVVLKDVCQTCCKQFISPIPCWYCMEVSYCSEDCRSSGWSTYHKHECGYTGLLKSVGIAHLGLRVALSGNMCDHHVPLDSRQEEYKRVFNLVTHQDQMDTDDLLQYAATAIMLTQYLYDYTKVLACEVESCVAQVAEVILRHITQLLSNGHAIKQVCIIEQQGDDCATEEVQQQRVATAVYPSSSMLNHSCEPNIINSFHNTSLIVRASCDIAKGEEVFNCYGPHFRRMKTKERQEILSGQYFFTCSCSRCSAPYDFLERFEAVQCSGCRGPLVLLPVDLYETLEQQRDTGNLHPHLGRAPGDILVMVCLDCNKHETVSDERDKKRFQVEKLIKQGDHNVRIGRIAAALTKFLDAWKIGREVLYKYHKNLSYAADQAARCLSVLGDYRRSTMFLQSCLLSVEERYGQLSIEVGNEMLKLTDVQLSNLNEMFEGSGTHLEMSMVRSSCSANLQRAHEIFTCLYGPSHPTVREVKEKQKLLRVSAAAAMR